MKGRSFPFFWMIPGLILGLLITACSSMFHGIYFTDYRVRKGDTIARIAERYGISVEDIMEANDILDPKSLEVGRVLQIPLHAESEKTFAATRSGRRIQLGLARKYIGKLNWPVPSTFITSPFGWRGSRFHEGVDIRGDYGTEISAAHDGIVIYSGRGLSGYGNLIAIKGDDGILTMYGHAQRNYVERGEKVLRGDPIGEVGSSGRTNGPHLHFEVRVRDSLGKYVAVNPLGFYR